MTTDVVAAGSQVRVVKIAPLGGDAIRATSSVQDFVAGEPFLDRLFAADAHAAREMLAAWRAAVEAVSPGEPAPLDLVPSQLRVTADGSVVLVGAELVADDVDGAQVLERGILEVAAHAAGVDRPSWSGEGVTVTVGSWLSVPVTPEWLEQAVDREADLRGRIAHRSGQTPEQVAAFERSELRRRLWPASPEPVPAPLPKSKAAKASPRGEAVEIARLRQQLAAAQREAEELRESTSWRVTAPLRRLSRLRRGKR